MDIPVFKNGWYYAALFVTVFIFWLAWISTKQLQVVLISPDGNMSFNFELIYRAIFNPLWGIVLFFEDKGRKKNGEHHSRILQNLQGVISDAMRSHRQTIRTDSLATLIYKQADVEKDIARRLDEGDTISEVRNNPIA